ncbi:MAG: ComEC/Rec2 family competence protein [Rickettsiales endosymbiont of Dermacentor nuttalli]
MLSGKYQKIVAFMSLCGSFGYLLISGIQVVAVRLFIMTSMIIIAVMLDRSANPACSLSFALIIILLFKPEVVVNPSFQISFMVVLALISCYNLYK